MNDCKLIGNLCKDPESFGSGLKIALATNDGYFKEGQWVDKGSDFHNVICNKYVAEKVNLFGLKKGDRIFVGGSIRYKKPEERGKNWYYNFEAKYLHPIVKERRQDNPDMGFPG